MTSYTDEIRNAFKWFNFTQSTHFQYFTDQNYITMCGHTAIGHDQCHEGLKYKTYIWIFVFFFWSILCVKYQSFTNVPSMLIFVWNNKNMLKWLQKTMKILHTCSLNTTLIMFLNDKLQGLHYWHLSDCNHDQGFVCVCVLCNNIL